MAVSFVFILCIINAAFINGNKTVYQNKDKIEFWDETEPFGLNSPSPNLRLPSHVVPSFYRLKLQTDLENSNFSGQVYITIRANAPVEEIILHSKNLSIDQNAKLTEQIYEKVGTLHTRSKRQADDNATLPSETTKSPNETLPKGGNDATNATLPSETSLNATISEINDISNSTSLPDNFTNNLNSSDVVNETVTENVETSRTTTEIISTVPDTQVTHSSVRNIKIVKIQEATGDRLILKLESALKPDVDYTLQLSFSGQISNALTGFYRSTYINANEVEKKLGVTQFEPTSARAAFPCFDEPAFKAMFEISIAHPDNITVLSNMKVSTEEDIPDQPGWKWTHFDRSVNMSTYLVAYVLSDFKSLEATYQSQDNVTKTIRVWTRPEYIDKGRYALNITLKLLSYYEEVFGVPYALDKLDLIAIPDFSSGAMENWGLITFRETTLLFDEVSGVPRDKQNVAIDVAHELAHQWFGNLVTMRWWTDLWLNEGFATYIEYLGVDYIEPEWNMLEAFARDKMDLLRSDALKNTSPVSRRVADATEISQKFDEISYSKGASLIRMLNHTISQELFHKGLGYYLHDWKYMNAAENDLWKAMSKATESDPSLQQLSVVEFMNSWTRQAGFPVVKVNRNYVTGLVEIEQKLFTSTDTPYQAMIDQLWHIPISYAGLSSPSETWTTKPKLWLKDRFQVVNMTVGGDEALYVNVDAVGYYRVNYDPRNWELLKQAMLNRTIPSPLARAQLIDDAFNLAKAGHLNYSHALDLTTYLIEGEESKIVWDRLLSNMAFLRYNLRTTGAHVPFQDYTRLVIHKQLTSLGYGEKEPKDDNEALLIENLMTWSCSVETPRCIQFCREHFARWMNNSDVNEIPSYLRSLVYNIAIKYGGRAEFDFLWEVFQNSTDPTVKSLAINNLPATRDEGLITLLLERSLTEIPKQYAVGAWSVEAGGARAAQRVLRARWARARRVFSRLDAFMFPAVLSGAFGLIADEDELDQLKQFAVEHKSELMPMSQTLQKLVDTARLRIDWRRKNAQHIFQWLEQFLYNYTHAPSSTPATDSVDNTSPRRTDAPNSDTASGTTPVDANVPVNGTGLPSDITASPDAKVNETMSNDAKVNDAKANDNGTEKPTV